MRKLATIYPTFLLAVILSGCAGVVAPETNLERLVYLEAAYGVILDKATIYANEGRLSLDQKETLTAAFDQYEQARALAMIAIDASDQGGFDNQTAAINTILSTVRTLLAGAQ